MSFNLSIQAILDTSSCKVDLSGMRECVPCIRVDANSVYPPLLETH